MTSQLEKQIIKNTQLQQLHIMLNIPTSTGN